MIAILDFVFLSPLLLSLFLILISLGSASYGASLIYQTLSAFMIFFAFLGMKLKRQTRRGSPVFGMSLCFLILVTLNLILQRMGWNSFTLTASGYHRMELAGLYFSGFAHFFYASQGLKDRPLTAFFLRILVGLTFLLALYFIALCFTSPTHSVESVSGPFPVLHVLLPLAGSWIQPNNLIDLFIPGFFYAFAFFLYRLMRPAPEESKRTRLSRLFLNFCLVAVLAAAFLFTKSRAGIVAVVVGFGLYTVCALIYHRREQHGGAHGRAPLLGFAAIILILFLSSLGVKEVIREMGTIAATVEEEISFRGIRSQILAASWQLIQKQGLGGVGLGNFHSAWLFLHEPPSYDFPANSYNDFLWIWAELGVAGFVLFSGMISCSIFRLIFLTFKTKSYFLAHMRLASAATLLAFALHALVDTTIFILPLYVLLMMVLGVGDALEGIENPLAAQESKVWIGFKRGAFIFLFLVACFTVGLNARRLVAYGVSQSGKKEGILMAQDRDGLNPIYPALYLRILEEEYRKGPSPLKQQALLQVIDEAIRRDSFQVLYYVKRAEVLVSTGDEKGAQESFEMMRDRLPNFYLGELAAAGFYMTQSKGLPAGQAGVRPLQALRGSDPFTDPSQAKRFEALAIRHYRKALELHPNLQLNNLYGLATQEALARFEELTRSGKI